MRCQQSLSRKPALSHVVRAINQNADRVLKHRHHDNQINGPLDKTNSENPNLIKKLVEGS